MPTAIPRSLQPLTPAGPGGPLFSVEDCNENMDSLIKLLKEAGGTVVQSDLKVCTCCHVLSVGLALCVATIHPHRIPRRKRLACHSSTCVDCQGHLTLPRSCTASAVRSCTVVQVRLGYQGKAGHRAFRRLRTTLEEEGYIQEVVGTIGADSTKPVVCIKCAHRAVSDCTSAHYAVWLLCSEMPWPGYLRHACNTVHITSWLPASPCTRRLQAAQGARCSWRCSSCR